LVKGINEKINQRALHPLIYTFVCIAPLGHSEKQGFSDVLNPI